MSTALITPAQENGLRHHFAALANTVREFCHQLYAVHGDGAPVALRREKTIDPSQLLALADRVETCSPNLSAELRNLASRG